MSAEDAIETFEIERKYEVGGDAILPDAEAFAAIGLTIVPAARHNLCANYFDTVDGQLAAQRLALRHRSGGSDEGWHLKAKGEDGARELLWPHQDEMPEGLRHEVTSRIGAEGLASLRAIASLHTDRRTAMLHTVAGEAVVELADDRVAAVNELSGRRQQWREWEAELMPGADAAVLDLIEPLLADRGAVRVRGTSKIQRTMQTEGDEQ